MPDTFHNMPVIFKPDVNFLEDEIGLLVTDQSDYYRESTRSAIMSVRQQCQADYSDLCNSLTYWQQISQDAASIPRIL
jgi:hypothetical protein